MKLCELEIKSHFQEKKESISTFMVDSDDFIEVIEDELKSIKGQILVSYNMRIGFQSMEIKSKKQVKKESEFIIDWFTKTQNLLEQYNPHKTFEEVEFTVNLPNISIFLPFFEWLQNQQQLKHLILQSNQILSHDETQILKQIITELFSCLKTMEIRLTLSNDQNINNNQAQKRNLEELKINVSNPNQDIDIISWFSNLRQLDLNFIGILSNPHFINETIQRVSRQINSIESLTLRSFTQTPQYLSFVLNFPLLQDLSLKIYKIEKNSIDLSKLKELKQLEIESFDPMDVFCSQKNIPNLEKLVLVNRGEDSFIPKTSSIKSNSVKEYEIAIATHKKLASVKIQNKGQKSSTTKYLLRDLQIILNIIGNLNHLEINLIKSQFFQDNFVPQEIFEILCQILSCKQEIEVSYYLKGNKLTEIQQCELGFAIRRFKQVDKFSLNNLNISKVLAGFPCYFLELDKMIQSNQIPQFSMLGLLGGSEIIANKILIISEDLVFFISSLIKKKSKKNEECIFKIKKIFYPFKSIKIKSQDQIRIEPQLFAEYLSPNLTYFRFNDLNLSMSTITEFQNLFPNLRCIKGYSESMTNFILNYNDNGNTNKSNTNLLIKLKIIEIINDADMMRLFEIVQGYFIQISYQNRYEDQIKIFKQIIKSNNRVLLFNRLNPKSQNKLIVTKYSQLIINNIYQILAFNSVLADLFIINPKMVYQDLLF